MAVLIENATDLMEYAKSSIALDTEDVQQRFFDQLMEFATTLQGDSLIRGLSEPTSNGDKIK